MYVALCRYMCSCMYFVQHVEIKAKSTYVCLVMYNSNYNFYIYSV